MIFTRIGNNPCAPEDKCSVGGAPGAPRGHGSPRSSSAPEQEETGAAGAGHRPPGHRSARKPCQALAQPRRERRFRPIMRVRRNQIRKHTGTFTNHFDS